MGNRLKAGASEVCITPKHRVSIAGYFDDRILEGVLDDIHTKAIVFDDGRKKFALISADVIAIPDDIVHDIRKNINSITGILAKNIFISATHTHTAPALGELFRVKPSKAYIKLFIEKVIESVFIASKNMRELTIEVGKGKSPEVAFNRRYIMRNGKIITNPPYSSDIIKPAGSVDEEIGVIRFTDLYKNPVAVIINCTNHVDTIGGNFISSDWPGHLSREIKNKLCKDVVVMFLNGAAGNINHFDILNNKCICNYDESKRIGKEYARVVLNILSKKMERVTVEKIRVASDTLKIPLRKITREQIKKALVPSTEAEEIISAIRDKPKIKKSLESTDLAKGNIEVEIRFAEELLKLAKEKKFANVKLTIFSIGKIVIVGIPGEPFVEIGLKIKKVSKFKYTFISELTNGYIGYIPIKKAFSQGGYETKLARSSKLIEDADKIIINSCQELFGKLEL